MSRWLLVLVNGELTVNNIVIRLLDNGIELFINGNWYTLSLDEAMKLSEDLSSLVMALSQRMMMEDIHATD